MYGIKKFLLWKDVGKALYRYHILHWLLVAAYLWKTADINKILNYTKAIIVMLDALHLFPLISIINISFPCWHWLVWHWLANERVMPRLLGCFGCWMPFLMLITLLENTENWGRQLHVSWKVKWLVEMDGVGSCCKRDIRICQEKGT